MTAKVTFQNVCWLMKKTDDVLEVVGTGFGELLQCVVERGRNHLPVNQCGSEEKQSGPVSPRSACLARCINGHKLQPNATGIQIITKITAEKERESADSR